MREEKNCIGDIFGELFVSVKTKVVLTSLLVIAEASIYRSEHLQRIS